MFAQESSEQTLEQLVSDTKEKGAIDVDLKVVVNHWDPEWQHLFVQDGKTAIFVNLTPAGYRTAPNMQVGDLIQLTGTFDIDGYALTANHIKVIKHGPPIPPLKLQMSKTDPGDNWSWRVLTTGQVITVTVGVNKTSLLLESGGKRFIARIEEEINLDLMMRLMNARIEVTGTMGAEIDKATGDPTRSLIHVMSSKDLKLLSPEDDVPEVSNTSLTELLAAAPNSDLLDGRIVSFECLIAHLLRDQLMGIEDGAASLVVPSASTELLDKGDRVRVMGSCRLADGTVNIDISALDIVSHETLPPARELTAPQIIDQGINQRRVTVVGELIDVASIGFDRSLKVRNEGIEYDVVFHAPDDEFQGIPLDVAKVISAEGWLTVNSTDDPSRFRVQLVSTQDLTILAAWPQMDRRDALTIISMLLVATLAGVAAAWLFFTQTRRKTKELQVVTARLQSTFESIHEGILVTDQDGRAELTNQRLQKILGFDPAQQPPENLQERLENCFLKAADFREFWNRSKSNPVGKFSTTLEFAGQEIEEVVIDTVPVRHSSGEPATRLWTFTDISELRNLESRLQQSQKMEAVGRLAGGIAHDFNNLLMVMSGNLEILQIQKAKSILSAAEQEELLTAMESAIQRARKMVQQLLGFSRKTSLDMTVVRPDSVTSRLALILQHTLGANVALSITTAPDLWPVKIDSVQVEQVLLNLCLNARDALPESGGKLSISCENSKESPLGHVVRYTVADNGSGMTKETLAKIYEPFFTTKPTGEGTGLGLAMSFGIIEQHHGRIHCESKPGAGTVFEIDFPRSYETPEVAPELQTAPQELTTESAPQVSINGRRVLVVDDEEGVRRVATLMFRELGCQVETACDGHDAICRLNDNPQFDLVVIDMVMPNLSGFATFEAITERFSKLPVVICSGYSIDFDRFHREAGRSPAGILEKPFDCNDITRVLSNIWNSDSSLVG